MTIFSDRRYYGEGHLGNKDYWPAVLLPSPMVKFEGGGPATNNYSPRNKDFSGKSSSSSSYYYYYYYSIIYYYYYYSIIYYYYYYSYSYSIFGSKIQPTQNRVPPLFGSKIQPTPYHVPPF